MVKYIPLFLYLFIVVNLRPCKLSIASHNYKPLIVLEVMHNISGTSSCSCLDFSVHYNERTWNNLERNC